MSQEIGSPASLSFDDFQHNQPTAAPRVFLGKERRHCALAERLVYVINFVYSVIVIDVVLSKFTC